MFKLNKQLSECLPSAFCLSCRPLAFILCLQKKRREEKEKEEVRDDGMGLGNAHVSRGVETDSGQIFTVLSVGLPRRPA